MMQRRRISCAIASLALASAICTPARSAGSQRRVGYLGNLSPNSTEARAVVDAFRQEMQRLGWVEGRDVVFEFRFADGDGSRFSVFARELVEAKVDLIAAMTTAAAAAARKAASTIPVVFIAAEPVENGLVGSLRRPGGNLTGMALSIDELLGKRMQLLTQAVPGVASVAYLGMNEAETIDLARASAKALKVELLLAQIERIDDLPRAVAAASRADAWLVDEYPMFNANRARIIETIAAQRKPAIFGSIAWAREGGLMAYSTDAVDLWRRAAGYVDRILRGAKPADLPVEKSRRFVLVINLRTARQLNLIIDKSVLLQADEVLE